MNSRICGFAIATAALVFSSCASTQLSHTWRDSSSVSRPLKKVLVIAVKKDLQTRRGWEDGFTAALSGLGVSVTPSHFLFTGELPDTSVIRAAASAQGFDGMILIGRTSRQTKAGVTAGYDITSPDYASHPWTGWYYAYYDSEYYPGYPFEEVILRDEVRIWATEGAGRMIWSGVGEFRKTGTREDYRHEMIDVVVSELVNQKVVATGS